MQKQLVRTALLKLRRHLSQERCFAASLAIQTRFLQAPEYLHSKTVALYSPIQNEVQTELVMHRALEDGKVPVYPRVGSEGLEFVALEHPGALTPGSFGVLEPAFGRGVSREEIDVFVIPGVAFDVRGVRLGYGKGYYDRVLGGYCQGPLIGFCYEFQLLDRLPAEVHDCRMNRIITENRTLTSGSPSENGALHER